MEPKPRSPGRRGGPCSAEGKLASSQNSTTHGMLARYATRFDSIPAQKKLLREYAAKNALTVVEVFEEAETAKRAGRKQCDRMRDFVRDNADLRDILVEKTDRLYRNFKDFSRLDIDQLGIRVHLVKEGEVLSRDSRSHQKFIHGIKVLMAKNYCDNLFEEVRKVLDERAAQGEWPSAAQPDLFRRVHLEREKVLRHA